MMKLTLPLTLALGMSVACTGDIQPETPTTTQPAEVELTPDSQGLLHADLFISSVTDLQTIGLAVQFEGAEVVSWTRDDTLLTSTGGQVLPLESHLQGTGFRMVVGTTAPVSSTEDQRVASFVLRPTGGDVRLQVTADSDDLGLLNRSGQRLDATAYIANGEEG